MFKAGLVISVMGGALIVSGCATRPADEPLDDLDPTAAGPGAGEIIVDNEDASFFIDGPWVTSTSTGGYLGDSYHVIARGTGENSAVWNLETIATYDIYARWTAYSNRASNAEYLIHYIDDTRSSAIDVVTVNQRTDGGQWVKLGTYRLSSLTGRVELTDAANGYVVADAIRFVPVEAVETVDTDGDGMGDAFEQQYGLNVNDPSDALEDLDGDGLTNLEEHDLGTDPTFWDTDGDGIGDSYEVSYGLDPLVDDASLDADGDGFTNLEEFDAGSGANDAASVPGAGPLITWNAPIERLDGSQLDAGAIAYYEVEYRPIMEEAGVIVDDASGYFEMVGASIAPSSHTPGYLGEGYHPIPEGAGNVYARWNFFELQPGITYQVESRWSAARNRSTNAKYRVRFAGDAGEQIVEGAPVDQTQNGGQWVEVAEFTPTDGNAAVELPSSPDGYVIADAVRLTPDPEALSAVLSVEPVNPTPGSEQSIRLEQELQGGQWVFRVRAVDEKGVASEYSEPLSVSFP
ncbi:hypothetical protein ACFOZ5_05535 [Marinobacter lacisalsi]|uniref:Golvesin/Xly CBD-like domain-containing protein n=1 Tax=Marinobacter lacisalsi TaxID=475979 RepID=A0ABV8QFG1_9GAMM